MYTHFLPSSPIPNCIMAYADELPPRYKAIRELLCGIFSCPSYVSVVSAYGKLPMLYSVIYLSPQVADIRSSFFYLMGDNHDRNLCHAALDAQIVPESLLLAEGLVAECDVAAATEGMARNLVLSTHAISSVVSPHLSLLGWDNHDYTWMRKAKLDDTIAGTLRDIALAQQENAVEEVLKLQSCLDELQERGVQTLSDCCAAEPGNFEPIFQTFPARTRSMLKTLEWAHSAQVQGTIKGRIFLIAGSWHLKGIEGNCDPRLSLTAFYEGIRKVNVVVLCPAFFEVQHSLSSNENACQTA